MMFVETTYDTVRFQKRDDIPAGQCGGCDAVTGQTPPTYQG